MTPRHAMSTPVVLMAHPSPDLYGSDRVFAESVRAVIRAGARAVVTLPANGALTEKLQEMGATVEFAPSPVLRQSAMTAAGLSNLASDTVRSLTTGAALIRRYGVTHLYVNTITIPSWLALGRLAGIPTTLHAHEAERSRPWPLRLALTLPSVLADRVIVNSWATFDALREFIPRAHKRYVLVRNPIEASGGVAPPRLELSGRIRLAYTGRLSARKGVDVLIDAVKILVDGGRDVDLTLVGDAFAGYAWFEDELREQVARRGLADRVTFAGFAGDVGPALGRADIAVVPARGDESFGNTAVEPLLVGRPVVVSANTGLEEAGAGYTAVRWCAPGDAESLASAIDTAIGDWPTMVRSLPDDAVRASARHNADTYRRRISDAVLWDADHARAEAATRQPLAGTSPKVVVAALTYHRNELLPDLITAMKREAATLTPPGDVLIVDNSADGQARDIAVDLLAGAGRYVHHPEGAISEARNRALDEAGAADVIVFLDDDETPEPGWLGRLVHMYRLERPAAVVGPVKPQFIAPVPEWISKGRLFTTARHPTGSAAKVAATNNLLLDLGALRRHGLRFAPAYGTSGGSDAVLTLSLTTAGERIIWVDDACVGDRVPASRMTVAWLRNRFFRLGNSSPRVYLEVHKPHAVMEAAVRGSFVATGVARVVYGGVRYGLGVALRKPVTRAQGMRTTMRGAGMVSGALGYVHQEYKRSPKLPTQSAGETSCVSRRVDQ